MGAWIYMASVAMLTYMVGYLSWRVIERPFLRRKRQTIRTAAKPPANAIDTGR